LKNIWWKRLDLWRAKNWILHSDNTPSPSTPCPWVSCQPQHVIVSAPTLLARFSPCRLLPFPEDENAAERSPFSHHCQDPAWIADYHIHVITKTPI
jgi:hypothetical protein